MGVGLAAPDAACSCRRPKRRQRLLHGGKGTNWGSTATPAPHLVSAQLVDDAAALHHRLCPHQHQVNPAGATGSSTPLASWVM